MSDGEILIFCSSGDDLNEALDFGLVVETHAEQLDGGVVDVVIGGDHAQVERGRVHVLLDADALAVPACSPPSRTGGPTGVCR